MKKTSDRRLGFGRSSGRNPSILICLMSGLLSLACAQPPDDSGSEQDPGPVVTVVGETPIHLAQLDDRIKDQLFEDTYPDPAAIKLQEARIEAANELIRQHLVAEKARSANQTPEDWMSSTLANLPPVSEEDIQAFWEENQERLSPNFTLETMHDRIGDYLEASHSDRFMEELVNEANLTITVPIKRSQVAATGASLGPEDAAVTIIEFSDFQCPYCARVVPTIKKIAQTYPDQVRLIYRHQPLSFHPNAKIAAQASVCAEEQGRFWDFHDLLFENQGALERETLDTYAEQVGLDLEAFSGCIDSPETVARVEADAAAANELGASGTPTFYINGVRLTGAQPFERFQEIIESELKASGS